MKKFKILFRSIFPLFIFVTLFTGASILFAETTSLTDAALLDQIQKKSLEYFTREVNPRNGLVPDKANNFQKKGTPAPASIAAVGFALTAYPVGIERGWLDYATAYEFTQRTLLFFLNEAPQERGFFYHFLNMQTGQRINHSELSPIDTALFLAGALFAAEYFNRPELTELVRKIYERVDFQWMLNQKNTLALSWSPEEGFSRHHWDHYDESMILNLLAISSPTHPIPASSWQEIARPVGSYAGYRVIQMPPLFTHQYSHIWIDFRNKNDGFADYFQNSVNATLANRQFCINQASKFSSYGPDSWGLTASDGPFGYKAYGAPPGWATHDGTIAPTACGSSIVFTPKESLACLRHFYESHHKKLWGMYGFSDAFNLDKNWFSNDVLGIDAGPLLLMIENHRSGLIWNTMAKNSYLEKAMTAVGFKPGTKDLPWPEPPQFQVPYVAGGLKVDGYLKDWPGTEPMMLDPTYREIGDFDEEKDIKAEARFAWDETFFYFSVKVQDQSVILKRVGKQIWMDDLFELFIDPQADGLDWGDEKDFQLGFRADPKSGGVLSWAWFQEQDPAESGMAAAQGFSDTTGYVLEGAIRWHALNLIPESGLKFQASPAIHDVDQDRSEGKLQWFFRNEEESGHFQLGFFELTQDKPVDPKTSAA